MQSSSSSSQDPATGHHRRYRDAPRPRIAIARRIDSSTPPIAMSASPQPIVGSPLAAEGGISLPELRHTSPLRHKGLLSKSLGDHHVPPTSPVVVDTHSPSMRKVTRELLGGRRSRNSIVDVRASSYEPREEAFLQAASGEVGGGEFHPLFKDDVGDSESPGYGSLSPSRKGTLPDIPNIQDSPQPNKNNPKMSLASTSVLSTLIQQTSAVAVVALLNMMIAIPFGASYFPIGWREGSVDDGADSNGDDDDVHGTFPLPGKQALGIRMFLFATLVGQLTFGFASKFENAIGLQMVENVPFLHALCHIVINQQGYGPDALSTVFFLFGLSSVIVGLVFYLLGHYELGKIVYFFPNHVLVGCIGGIGVFIVITAIEVTSDVTFTFDMDGLRGLRDNFHLLVVVLGFEGILRLLMFLTQDTQGRPKYPLLSPIYYCMITPMFYVGLWIFGLGMESATDQGYFFPPIEGGDSNETTSILQDPHLWDMFKVFNISSISWMAVLQSSGSMIALAAFSLIHVPINIPAFAISTDVDTDMNAELVAHGYANALSGLFGGLQNYMTYSNSVLYAKAGGKGVVSSLAITVLTGVLFVVGPSIASFLPRCMAGTLLLHIGVDLILEGVYDSYGNYDLMEYAGIWVIAGCMTIWGMTAALIAGVIAAMSTYAVQSINYQNPIRQILTASTLRSSAWARCAKSRAILENELTGRSRILIFQLQGHLFFGNVAQLTDTIKEVLKNKWDYTIESAPIIVIVDFTLVVGMDSSAAHAVAKLKKIIHRLFNVEISIFVTGTDRGGFPCEFALTQALCPESIEGLDTAGIDWTDMVDQGVEAVGRPFSKDVKRGSISVSPGTASVRATKQLTRQTDGRVCESLDEALKFAEDILIAREDPSLMDSSSELVEEYYSNPSAQLAMTLDEEDFWARKFLRELLVRPAADNAAEESGSSSDGDLEESILNLAHVMRREEYSEGDVLWEQGAESRSLKLLISGVLLSYIDDTGASEPVKRGNIVGELGLVHGTPRLTTLLCASKRAVLYSLDQDSWERLNRQHPHLANRICGVAIRYLAHRVQHVSNRYFHTTLPV